MPDSSPASFFQHLKFHKVLICHEGGHGSVIRFNTLLLGTGNGIQSTQEDDPDLIHIHGYLTDRFTDPADGKDASNPGLLQIIDKLFNQTEAECGNLSEVRKNLSFPLFNNPLHRCHLAPDKSLRGVQG